MKFILKILILSTFLWSSPEVATKNNIKIVIQHIDKRFEAMQEYLDKRLEAQQEYMEKRLETMQEYIEIRFEASQDSMDKRFEASKDNINKKFSEMHDLMYGFMVLIGLIFTLIIWDRRTKKNLY